MNNFIKVMVVGEDGYEDNSYPTSYPDIHVYSESEENTRVVELCDATTDPLQHILEVCRQDNNYQVSIKPTTLYWIVHHPLVECSWENYKYLWKKVDGVWVKTTYEFKEDTILNFRGIDWFM